MQEISEDRLTQLEMKVEAIRGSVEKTRRYLQVTMWVTVVFLVVPLVGSVFILPIFLSSYLGAFDAAVDGTLDPSTQSQLDLLEGLLE